jgi:hypothetical protein
MYFDQPVNKCKYNKQGGIVITHEKTVQPAQKKTIVFLGLLPNLKTQSTTNYCPGKTLPTPLTPGIET